MPLYATFPCCACKPEDGSTTHGFSYTIANNMCKIGELNLGIDIILQSLFFYVNPNFDDEEFIENMLKVEIKHLNLKETTMVLSIIHLLENMLKTDNPTKININLPNSSDNISSFLIEQLNDILEHHNQMLECPFHIIVGNTTFQKLVLNILLFAVNYLTQCIEKLDKYDKTQMFYIVVKTVHNFLWEKNIATWISHSIQETHPFGRYEFAS